MANTTDTSREQAALYRKWNPTSLDDICGNVASVEKCKKLMNSPPSERPGFYLLSGATGTGKSTLVHILAKGFGCDQIEVFNSREAGKLDFVTDFLSEMLPKPSLTAHSRAFIFEEAHNITSAAQEMFMEPMEKGVPPNTYVFFVTNVPERLTGGKGALASRPFIIQTQNVKPREMIDRLELINNHEELGLTSDDLAFCAKACGGSVRTAINNMSRLSSVPEELRDEERYSIELNYSEMTESTPKNIKDLAIAMETQDWDKIAPILRDMRINGDDPEGIRRGLLGWYTGTILSDSNYCRPKRTFARACLETLKDNYYSSGFPGLVLDLSHLVKGL